MECDRCQGLMLKDSFVSIVGPLQQEWLCAWRCVDCGLAIDPITLVPHQEVREDEGGSGRQAAGSLNG